MMSDALKRRLRKLKGAACRVEMVEKIGKEMRSQRGSGSLRSFRGTYDEDPTSGMLPERVNHDSGAIIIGSGTFVVGKKGEKGRFVPDPRPNGFEPHRLRMGTPLNKCAPEIAEPIDDGAILPGSSYFRHGKGRAPGTNPPAYDSPMYKRGVGPDDTDGFKRSHRQKHDKTDYRGATTHMRDRASE